MVFQETDCFALKSNLIYLDAIIQETYHLDRKWKGQICNAFPHYKKPYQKSCTLDAWTFGLWMLGLWTPGRLESGRQDAWILDNCKLQIWTPEILNNSLTFSNYTFATKVIL